MVAWSGISLRRDNTSGESAVPDGWPAVGSGAFEQRWDEVAGETIGYFAYQIHVDGKACHRAMFAQVNSPAEQVSEETPANPEICPIGCGVEATADPAKLCPGDESTITVTVENKGDCRECYVVTGSTAGAGLLSGPEEICLEPQTSGTVELVHTASAFDSGAIGIDIEVEGDRGSCSRPSSA